MQILKDRATLSNPDSREDGWSSVSTVTDCEHLHIREESPSRMTVTAGGFGKIYGTNACPWFFPCSLGL